MFKRYTFEVKLSCLSDTPQLGAVDLKVDSLIKDTFPAFSLVSIKDTKSKKIHAYRTEYTVRITSSRKPKTFEPVAVEMDKDFQNWTIREIDGDQDK